MLAKTIQSALASVSSGFSQLWPQSSLGLGCLRGSLLLILHLLGAIHPAILHHCTHPLIIFSAVPLVQLGGLHVSWGCGIGVTEETLDTGQYGGDVVDGRPLVLEDIQTDFSIRIDVWVEHLGNESHQRWLRRVAKCMWRWIAQGEGEYSSVNSKRSWNVPPSQGVSSGPNMTACQLRTLLSKGAAWIPEGGSAWRRLKSLQRNEMAMLDKTTHLMSRLRAEVDMSGMVEECEDWLG